MTAIDSTRGVQYNQQVSGKTQQKQEAGAKGFAEELRRLIPNGGQNTLHEKDLFAGLVAYQIGSQKGQSALNAFNSYYDQVRAEGGVRGTAQAINRAIKKTRVSGELTRDEAHQIRNRAFGSAQLDRDIYRLGSPRDRYDIEGAIASAEAKLSAYESGAERPMTRTERLSKLRSMRESEAGASAVTKKGKELNPSDGSGGFLFKPESDNTGNLVVLLPSQFSNNVQSCSLTNAKGKVLEEGTASGIANGDREHFRFSRPGSDYPSGLYVEVKLRNGEALRYQISDPSQRYD